MGIIDYQNLEFGNNKELQIKETLEKIFGKLKHNIHDKFSKFDFENEKFDIEYKFRNCYHDQYDGFFMTKTKVNHALKSNKIVYWIFEYDDGLFYIDFNKHKKLILSLDYKKLVLRNGDVRYNINIPTELLSKLNTDDD